MMTLVGGFNAMVLLAVTCYIEELQEKNQVKAVSLGSALLLSKEL